MSDVRNDFSNRLKLVERKHVRLARGYDCKVGRDGLIVFRAKRRKVSFPYRGLVLLLLAFVGFKALVMAQIGDAAYLARIDALHQGPLFERVGAFVMQPDPVSTWISGTLLPLIW